MDLTEKQGASDIIILPIRFTGTGSEYFRIWITNLLLIVLTLGLYTPWAKARRMRYFWGNTLVDGDALGFHGDPKQMFKGWALICPLFFIYSFASDFSILAGIVAFAVLAAIWPALMRSSMCFRMGNTSWRGLRMRFSGSLRDAYRVYMPLLLMLVPFAVLALWQQDTLAKKPQLFFILPLAVLVITPWISQRIKYYQHQHYALGPLQTEFWARVASFYGLFIKPIIFILGISIVPVLAGLVFVFGLPTTFTGFSAKPLPPIVMIALSIIFFLFLQVLFFGVGPWITARTQNLVWNNTKNSQIRFVSALSFRSMLWLTVKNAVLIMLTLGLYWPFAKIAVTRLRLEAVHIRSRTRLDALLASAHKRPNEAMGDAAGDFFGLDVGL